MDPYYQDEHVTLHHGDAGTVLATLPGESVDCIVTSPPYFGLRDYGVTGQIGAETSPAEFVAAMVAVFREARRVLANDGTLWLNLGDSYSSGARTSYADTGKASGRIGTTRQPSSLPGKNLLGVPWRVAFALQDDGWILRNDIIWAKPNGMPESVNDRLASKHENLFLLTKSPRYWFDLNPIREAHAETSIARSGRKRFAEDRSQVGVGAPNTIDPQRAIHAGGKNPGDVWTVATQPFAEAHFATMPPALAERCVQAGCKPHGTVLDPFSGSGTTGMAAAKHGRRYIGIDLNADYLKLSLETRLRNAPLDLGF